MSRRSRFRKARLQWPTPPEPGGPAWPSEPFTRLTRPLGLDSYAQGSFRTPTHETKNARAVLVTLRLGRLSWWAEQRPTTARACGVARFYYSSCCSSNLLPSSPGQLNTKQITRLFQQLRPSPGPARNAVPRPTDCSTQCRSPRGSVAPASIAPLSNIRACMRAGPFIDQSDSVNHRVSGYRRGPTETAGRVIRSGL
jgi:hypothetical protein